MELDGELLSFLSSSRADVQTVAVEHVTGLTGTDEGCALVAANHQCVASLAELVGEQNAASRAAARALVNVTAHDRADKTPHVSQNMFTRQTLLTILHAALNRSNTLHADVVAMLLSNVSRSQDGAQQIISLMQESTLYGFDSLINAVCDEKYNEEMNLDYLSQVLENLTQILEARHILLSKQDEALLPRLLPFLSYQKSLIKRSAVAATIRNCCFQTEFHEVMLKEVDILPWLLLPLAGPEDFDEDDMERLPLELQYLEGDKQRETDSDVRRILVEAINQLCATRFGRIYIRDKNAYVILRELHNWEEDEAVLEAVENLVSVLISDEAPEDMQDLTAVEIPENMLRKSEPDDSKEKPHDAVET